MRGRKGNFVAARRNVDGKAAICFDGNGLLPIGSRNRDDCLYQRRSDVDAPHQVRGNGSLIGRGGHLSRHLNRRANLYGRFHRRRCSGALLRLRSGRARSSG